MPREGGVIFSEASHVGTRQALVQSAALPRHEKRVSEEGGSKEGRSQVENEEKLKPKPVWEDPEDETVRAVAF
eukprot:1184037-Prorocentrum_minimum.AAC.8